MIPVSRLGCHNTLMPRSLLLEGDSDLPVCTAIIERVHGSRDIRVGTLTERLASSMYSVHGCWAEAKEVCGVHGL